MTNEEKVIYLANVVLISAVDGEVTPIEAKAIDSIRNEIGATEPHLHKALTAVSQGDHKITPIGRFSDKIRNLEDMIWVSLTDGQFHKSEKPEVLSFAKSVKISQDQLTEILTESKLRIKSQDSSLKCTSCNNEIPPESKFCPICGAKV